MDRASGGRWDQAGVPHLGWSCTGEVDLGADGKDYTPATCEMCGNSGLRYVYTMSHPDHPDLAVGCVCAGHMEQNVHLAKQRERALKNKERRRIAKLKRDEEARQRQRNYWLRHMRWKKNRKGNDSVDLDDTHIGVWQEKDGSWRWWVGPDREKDFSSERYASSDEAKLALLDEWNARAPARRAAREEARRRADAERRERGRRSLERWVVEHGGRMLN